MSEAKRAMCQHDERFVYIGARNGCALCELEAVIAEREVLRVELETVLTPTRDPLESPPSGSVIQQANAWARVWAAAVEVGLLSYLNRLEDSGADRVVAFIRHLAKKAQSAA